MNVRDALPADLPVLVSFQQRMAAETESLTLNIAVVSRGVQAVFDDRNKGHYVVVEHEEGIIACLLITVEWSDWRNGQIWWIQSVYVEPEFRGRGVFRLLYDHIQQRARADSSVRGLRLYVDKTNKPAQQAYEKLGMNGEHYRVFEWMKDA